MSSPNKITFGNKTANLTNTKYFFFYSLFVALLTIQVKIFLMALILQGTMKHLIPPINHIQEPIKSESQQIMQRLLHQLFNQ